MSKGFGRKYPKGRISGDDDGQCSLGLASDLEAKRVILRFDRPMAWMGFDLESGAALLHGLAKHLSKVFNVVISVQIGEVED